MAREKEPVIEIDDLAPKTTIAGYRATWKANGVVAHAELLPLQDQPARGFVLDLYTSNESARPMGKRQQERADELIPLVKARMLDAMRMAGWQVVGTLDNPPMDIWQHSSRVIASASSLVQGKPQEQDSVTNQEKESKVILVPLRKRDQGTTYQRTITKQQVTLSCSTCGQEVTRTQYPGPISPYCDACAKEVEKEQTRARVARLRERRREKAVKSLKER